LITNLLNNAIKFTEKGFVEIIVNFEPINHKIGKYSIIVKDTGIGIEQSKLKNIFKPFSQAIKHNKFKIWRNRTWLGNSRKHC